MTGPPILTALLMVLALVAAPVPGEGSALSLEVRSPPQPVAAPGTVTLAFWLVGCAHNAVNVTFRFTLPEAFRCLAAPEARALDPGAAELLLLTLLVPVEVPPGTHSVIVHAEAAGVEASAAAEVRVRPRIDVRLEVPPGGSATPGGEVAYRLRMENLGNVPYEVEVEARSSWPATLVGGRVHLPAGATVERVLVHQVPATAEPGSRVRLHIEIRTRTVPSVRDEGVVWTTVRPPVLSEVPTRLYPLLPGVVQGTLLMEGGRLQGEGRIALSGSIGSEQALSLSGLVRVRPHGVSWQAVQLSYIHSALQVHLGHIALPPHRQGGVAHGLILHHAPVASPYRVRVYASRAGSALELHVGGGVVGGTLVASGGEGGSLTVFAAPGPLRMEARLTTTWERLRVSWRGAGLTLSASRTRGEEHAMTVSLSTASLTGTFTGHPATPKGWAVEVAMRLEGRLEAAAHMGFEEHPLRGTTLDAFQVGCSASGDRVEWAMCVELSRAAGWTPAEDLWTVRLGGGMAVRTSCGSTFGADADAWFASLPLATRVGRWRFVLSGELPLHTNLAAGGLPEARRSPSFRGSLTVGNGVFEWGGKLAFEGTTLSIAYGVRKLVMSFETKVSLPVPVVMTKGRVEGEIRGSATEGLLLELGGAQAITCDQGRFRMPPMEPGTYVLRLLSLPPGKCVVPGQRLEVLVRAGEVTPVQMALVSAAELTGRLTVADGDIDQGIAEALVTITDGTDTYRTRTDARGVYRIGGLCPGTWTVSVELPRLIPPHDLDRAHQTVDVKPGDRVTVDFVARPRARPLRPLGLGCSGSGHA